MIIAKTKQEVKDYLKTRPGIGFVPTMGNLHDGHLALVAKCCRENTVNVVSIFVNPAQFGPREDLAAYPRTLDLDIRRLEDYKVDLVFCPTEDEIYDSQTVYIDESNLSQGLCGKFRPGHFRGVLTVVNKFFNLIKPARAYFGRKDYQQYILIKKMVFDLDMAIDVIVCPIAREPGGLALSSRNQYLTAKQRQKALQISRALIRAKDRFNSGETDAVRLRKLAAAAMPDIDCQYIELVEPLTLASVTRAGADTVLAIAGYVGQTRLIDNTVLGEVKL